MSIQAQELFKKFEEIGNGTFGKVFRGIDLKLQSPVAIKVLDLDTEDDELLDIQREISILSKCDSVYITRYHGAYLSGSKLWLILDYAAMGSMRNIMKSGPLDETIISIIIKQVLHALIYLHKQANIIHRDIKAANILLTDDGQVKLCDFGVAGQISMNNLRRNSFVGTPYWISPEIVKRSNYDYKTDIWSLGVTVIELATGNPPFSEYDPRQALFMISNSRPAKLDGHFSEAIKEFVALCLQEEPAERPTAEDLLKTRFIKHAPGGTQHIQELIKRHKAYQDKEKEDNNNQLSEEDLQANELKSEDAWIFETIRESLLPKNLDPIELISPPPTELDIESQKVANVSNASTIKYKDSQIFKRDIKSIQSIDFYEAPENSAVSNSIDWSLNDDSIENEELIQNTKNEAHLSENYNLLSTILKENTESVLTKLPQDFIFCTPIEENLGQIKLCTENSSTDVLPLPEPKNLAARNETLKKIKHFSFSSRSNPMMIDPINNSTRSSKAIRPLDRAFFEADESHVLEEYLLKKQESFKLLEKFSKLAQFL